MPSITDSIGRVLGDRYRLVTAIGAGASAFVYLADDVSLDRRVAIKVLHPALSADAGFLKRFRAEARVAAALNHPNILQVYDWGEEGDAPYLVLEFLGGGSLRQLLDAGVRLTPSQAVAVGRAAVAGLDYAHRRGLVHRDVKPANLLFDTDGRLRIADFGLARALAEATWTEPAGAVLGTARYAAPEQVEGKPVDGRADVYALALVLFEAVTGMVPFAADTTVATLMARVGVLLPEHDDLGPLNDVLLWAAAPDLSERYDAGAFGLRLEALAVALPAPDPIPVLPGGREAWTDGTVPYGPLDGAPTWLDDDRDRTQIGPITDRGAGAGGAKGASAGGYRGGPSARLPEPTSPRAPAGATAAPARRRHRWRWVVAVVLVLALVIGAGAVVAVRDRLFVPSHPIPTLVGDTLVRARQVVGIDDFSVRQTATVYDVGVPKGAIVSQRPGSGRSHGHPTTAKQGAVIDVTISRGPPPVAFPPLTTFTSCSDAEAALAALHLVGVCPPSAARYSSSVHAGGVVGSVPAGQALYGSTVTIELSLGRAPVTVPDVTGAGSSYASAAAALRADGFVPKEAKEYDASVTAGEVVGTAPAPGAGPQPYGSSVTVEVSLGPQPVAVPNVIGDTVAQATTALNARGLVVGGPFPSSGPDIVLYSYPPTGTQVLPGTTVNLYKL